MTKEDFKAAALEKTRRIDILDFVEASSIDDRFFDKPYYLTPGKGGDMAYALLREAIRESGRIGIAKFILREVQHLAAVEVVDEALVLPILRFADELVEVGTLRPPKRAPVRKKELDVATSLVESLAEEWKPEKYSDDYRENLMRVITAKMKGKKADLVSDEPRREAKVSISWNGCARVWMHRPGSEAARQPPAGPSPPAHRSVALRNAASHSRCAIGESNQSLWAHRSA